MPDVASFDVFLSHNSQDKPAVEALARRLEDEAGLRPWLDKWNQIPGDPWQESLEAALDASRACAVFIGPSGIGPWENEEMRSALDIRVSKAGFRVVPVLLPGASPPERGKLPRFLSLLTWVDFRAGLDNKGAFRRLVAGIRGTVPGRDDTSISKPPFTECPYRGFQVFEQDHEEFFIGREAMTQHLVEALRSTRFLAVIGPSGSGKSSLIRAGLLPKLKAGILPSSKHWTYISFRPGAHPLETLAISLAHLRKVDDPLATMRQILGNLQADEKTLHLQTRFLLIERPEPECIFIFIDQFEEILTLCHNEEDRAQFIANIQYATAIEGGQTVIVVTMAADSLARAAEHKGLTQLLSGPQFSVSPMADADLRRAIEEPARLAGLSFESGLIERILKDVGHEPGLLPLLEDTLLKLYQKKRIDNVMTLQAYDESGGVHGTITKRAGEVFERLTPEQQTIGRRILLQLTQFGDDTEDTRRRIRISELCDDQGEQPYIEEVIEILTNARLLTTSTDGKGRRQLDVAHEALIRGWPDLRKWIDENRVKLRIHRKLTEAAQEWEERNEDASFLYRGMRLAQAREWLKINKTSLNLLEQKFLSVSKSVEQQERYMARLNVILNIIGLVIIVLLFSYQIIDNFQPLKKRVSDKLVASASSELPINPEMSLSFALEALRVYPTVQAEAALKEALTQTKMRKVLFGNEGPVMRAVFSPDSKMVVTTSYAETARIWNVTRNQCTFVLQGHKDIINSAAFSPDGRRVVTASADKTARIWDVDTGKSVQELRGHAGVVISAVFNHDGTRVVTASADGRALVWDAATGRILSDLSKQSGIVYKALFSPDGTKILTASADGTVLIWDATKGRILQVLSDHKSIVSSAAFSADSKQVVITSQDETAVVWDIGTGLDVCLKSDPKSIMNSVAFSPDSNYVLTAGYDGTIRIWDTHTGKAIRELRGYYDMRRYYELFDDKAMVRSAIFTPDGTQVLTTGYDGAVRIWDPAKDELKDVVPGRKKIPDPVTGQAREQSEPQNITISATFSADGKQVVVASRNREVDLDIATRSPVSVPGHKKVTH